MYDNVKVLSLNKKIIMGTASMKMPKKLQREVLINVTLSIHTTGK